MQHSTHEPSSSVNPNGSLAPTMAALMTSLRDLPIEMVTSILAKLPSKSLLRFRCVCKSWRDLISDRKFIELHRNQNGNGHVLIEYEPKNSLSNDFRCSLLCDKTFVQQTRLELPFEEFRILGHSNGLVCFAVRHSFLNPIDLYLWNPSIRKSKLLPKSPSPFDEYRFSTILAFGFVPQLNDYRVLKTVRNDYLDKKKFGGIGVKFEIYSMNTHSWKLLDNVVSWQLCDNGIGLIKVMNGVVHLKARGFKAGDGYEEFILTFDMADEEFGKINILQFSRIYRQDEEIRPFVFGQLGQFFILSFYNKTWADIWTKMKEHDAAESWTKKLTIDELVEPLGFLKNGELVLQYSDPDRLTSYDPRLPEPMDLQFDAAPWSVYSFNHYLESLVLLNEGN